MVASYPDPAITNRRGRQPLIAARARQPPFGNLADVVVVAVGTLEGAGSLVGDGIPAEEARIRQGLPGGTGLGLGDLGDVEIVTTGVLDPVAQSRAPLRALQPIDHAFAHVAP